MDWAPSDERFVEIPGIVEIRWVSDDPDYYQEPIDLFDEQNNGLPDYYGKKDKQTTEQAWFTCNVCECDLKSVVTLRAHCKGSQHVRKALQKKAEYKRKLKKEADAGGASTSQVDSQRYNTLFDWLEATSEAVVGLKFITEYRSSRSSDPPMYHCSICDDTQGDAEFMKNHILSLKHRQSFLWKEIRSFLVHQAEIQQAVAEFTKDYRRDYREMGEVKDDRAWKEISKGTFRPPRERSRSPKRERRDHYDGERRTKRERSRSPRRPKQESGEFFQHDDRDDRGRHSYNSRRDDYEDRARDRYYDRHSTGHSSNSYDNRQSSHDGRHYTGHSSNSPRNASHRDSGSDISREKSRSRDSFRVKNEYRDEEDISEVSRSGNFENWSTARIKTSRDDQDPVTRGPGCHVGGGEAERVSSVEEDISRLHRRVATHVMNNMNKYYPDTEEFDPGLHKIRDGEEYSRTAKMLSHKLRAKIKESFEAYNGSLEGISLTPDHVAFIVTEVERHFEQIPVIRSGSRR